MCCVVLSGLSTLQRYKIRTPLVKYFGIFFQTFFRRAVGNAKRMDGDGYMRGGGVVFLLAEREEGKSTFSGKMATFSGKGVNFNGLKSQRIPYKKTDRVGQMVSWSVLNTRITMDEYRDW